VTPEERVEKLKADNAELREKIEDWRAKNLQLELVQKDLQAQLSKSQERVKVLERLAIKKQWENIKQ
jgi:hypothetical protein